MGVATFKTTKQMPNEIKKELPNSDELGKLLRFILSASFSFSRLHLCFGILSSIVYDGNK